MRLTLGAALAVCNACVLLAGSAPELPASLSDLHRLDRLPLLRHPVKVGSVSSYDRTGGNDDGFSGKYSFVRKDPEGLVLADLKGPGVITRVWTPTPSDDVLEFLFDGESTPRVSVKYRDLFLGGQPGFPRPLVGFGVGGYYCYVPMPFARSCVVRIRAPKTQFYQINYALYAPDTAVTTFQPDAPADRAELERTCAAWNHPGADASALAAPPGTRLLTKSAAATLAPRSAQTIWSSTKGGRIVGLRVGPAGAVAGKARDLLLRIRFDGGEPAVLCPLGDFFGYAWGQPAVQSLLVGTADGTNYAYFPMPFDRRAEIELVSERAAPVSLQTEVVWANVPRAANEGRFHALWRRENPTQIGEPYTFLDTQGRGHLVGLVLQSQGFESGKTLFFEGDDQTTIDGELAIHGTGSEDFFNGGWYDVPDRWEKRLSFPLSGCLGYAKHLGRTGAYRLFLTDAYHYQRSLRQVIEHAGEKNSIPTDYCSVTYFYAAERPSVAITVPPLAQRAVHDLNEVIFPMWWQTPLHAWSFDNATLTRKKVKLGNEDVRYLALTGTGQDWFGPHFLSPTCDVPVAGRYAIQIEAVKGPGQGQVQLFQNENPAGPVVDLYAATPTASGRVTLGRLDLVEGPNHLMLKLVGKNEASSGLGLDLVSVICAREP